MSIQFIDNDYSFISYLKYLRDKGDCRIPQANYGEGKIKPFFICWENDEFYWISQLSSPKTRHFKMRQTVDFIKVYDRNGKFISVINLNYMFPVPKSIIKIVPIETLCKEKGSDKEDEMKYLSLLREELLFLTKKDFSSNCSYLYNNRIIGSNTFIASRCLDYKNLEQKAKEYNDKD